MTENRTIARGQIWLVQLQGSGSVQNSLRPCTVISNKMNNLYSPTVCVVPLTSRVKRMLPTHVFLENTSESGLKRESIILCEQIQTVDKSQLVSYIGEVDERTMNKIESAIMIQLGILEPNQIKKAI